MTSDISFPEEFLEYFNGSRHELIKINRIILAIELYLEKKISIAKAAELSRLSESEFREEFQKRQVKPLENPLTEEKTEINLNQNLEDDVQEREKFILDFCGIIKEDSEDNIDLKEIWKIPD